MIGKLDLARTTFFLYQNEGEILITDNNDLYI